MRNVLEHIADESIDNGMRDGSNVNSSQSGEEDDSSVIMEMEDTDALRLDTPEAPLTGFKSPKQLFYTEDEQEDALDPLRNIGITERPKKKVRFNKDNNNQKEIVSNDESEIYPWELKKVIRNAFREKLPNNYEVKRWKKPSKIMVNSVMQLLETNFQNSIDQVFEKYKTQLQEITHENSGESQRIYRQRQSIMNDVMGKIKLQLKKSRFPSRISERDVDIEYIVAKRHFIQKRYADELCKAEEIENELLKEQRLLKEANEACMQLKDSNRGKLMDVLVQKNLHPSLSKAIENAYGLIKDSESAGELEDSAYEKDISELNVNLKQKYGGSNDLEPVMTNYLPSLKQLSKATTDLQKNMLQFTEGTQRVVKEKLVNE